MFPYFDLELEMMSPNFFLSYNQNRLGYCHAKLQGYLFCSFQETRGGWIPPLPYGKHEFFILWRIGLMLLHSTQLCYSYTTMMFTSNNIVKKHLFHMWFYTDLKFSILICWIIFFTCRNILSFKGTLMQIWKFVNIFIFIWK